MTILNDLGQYRSKRCTPPPIVNKKIKSSTPITNKVTSFEINSLLSPIRTPIEDEHHFLSTNKILFREGSYLKNMINNNNGEQISLISKTKELSRADILNTSQHIVDDVQNFNVSDSNNMNDTVSQMFFISRNPKHIQDPNNTTLSNENDLSYTRSEKSFRSTTKDENISTSIYFDNLKRVKRKELIFETPNKKKFQEKKSTEILKECLSEKIKKNIGLKHFKYLQKIKTRRIKINKNKTKKLYSKSKMNRLQRKKKQTFSDFSISDLDKTSHIPVTMNSSLWTNKFLNKIENDSLKLNCNDTWVKNIKNLSADLESSSNDSTANMIIRTNSSLKLNQLEQDKNMKYSNVLDTTNMNSTMFSKDSVFLSNLKGNNSQSLESIKDKFMNESQDSCDSSYNYKENSSKKNKMTVSFNNILIEDIPDTTFKKNVVSI